MIKFTYKYLKPVALFLTIAFLFQSCIFYHKQSVTVVQAMDKTTIMIVTTDDREIYFDKIYYKNDGILYGAVESKKAGTIETIIPKESIKEIHLKDDKKSGAGNALVALSVIGVFAGMIIYSLNHMFE